MTLKDLIQRLKELKVYGELTDVVVNDCKIFDIGYNRSEDVIYLEN